MKNNIEEIQKLRILLGNKDNRFDVYFSVYGANKRLIDSKKTFGEAAKLSRSMINMTEGTRDSVIEIFDKDLLIKTILSSSEEGVKIRTKKFSREIIGENYGSYLNEMAVNMN